jgi:Fe2+ or Zn2+ uptake regulation protein
VRDHVHTPPVGPSELRAKGRRITRQRELIWEALTSDPERHLSADEVVERVRDRMPQVSSSTVYRTLDLLVDEGLVLRTDLGADRAYYEPAREHAHHHLVCERCGAVRHLHDEELGNLRARVRKSTGFTLGRGEITLFGLCERCHSQ